MRALWIGERRGVRSDGTLARSVVVDPSL